MIRKLIALFTAISACMGAFASGLDELEADVRNFGNRGYRPLSLGVEYYVGAQGGITGCADENAYAILGEGWFVLASDDGKIFLSRNGFFRSGDDGTLVNHDGYHVLGVQSDIKTGTYVFLTENDVPPFQRNTRRNGMMPRALATERATFPFLTVVPIEGTIILDGEYLMASECREVESYILRCARESFPLSFEALLDLCIERFDAPADDAARGQRQIVYELLRQNFVRLCNDTFITDEGKRLLAQKLEETGRLAR